MRAVTAVHPHRNTPQVAQEVIGLGRVAFISDLIDEARKELAPFALGGSDSESLTDQPGCRAS